VDPHAERRIERLIHRPESMTDQERVRARQLLEKDPGAALYAQHLRGVYEQLENEQKGAISPRVDEFIDQLFGREEDFNQPGTDSVIPVRPYEPSSQARPTVLAAETPDQKDSSRFVLLASLTSSSESVLVRVVADQKTNRGHLYLLSSSEEEAAYTVVSFPGIRCDVMTDEDGRATFDLSSSEGEHSTDPESLITRWSNISAVVRRPVDSKNISPVEETVLMSRFPSTVDPFEDVEKSRVHCQRQSDTMTITIQGERDQALPHLGVTGPEGSSNVYSLRSACGVPQLVPGEGTIVLRLYQ
jgi:hypothetical protein